MSDDFSHEAAEHRRQQHCHNLRPPSARRLPGRYSEDEVDIGLLVSISDCEPGNAAALLPLKRSYKEAGLVNVTKRDKRGLAEMASSGAMSGEGYDTQLERTSAVQNLPPFQRGTIDHYGTANKQQRCGPFVASLPQLETRTATVVAGEGDVSSMFGFDLIDWGSDESDSGIPGPALNTPVGQTQSQSDFTTEEIGDTSNIITWTGLAPGVQWIVLASLCTVHRFPEALVKLSVSRPQAQVFLVHYIEQVQKWQVHQQQITTTTWGDLARDAQVQGMTVGNLIASRRPDLSLSGLSVQQLAVGARFLHQRELARFAGGLRPWVCREKAEFLILPVDAAIFQDALDQYQLRTALDSGRIKRAELGRFIERIRQARRERPGNQRAAPETQLYPRAEQASTVMQGVAFPQELFAAGTATTGPVMGGPSSMPVLNQPQRPPQAPATSRQEREQLCLALQRQFPELLPRYVEGFVVSTLVENAQPTRSFVHPSNLVRQQGNGQMGSRTAVGSMTAVMNTNFSMTSQQSQGQALMAALSASSRLAGRAAPGQGASTQASKTSAEAEFEKTNRPSTSLGFQQRETSLTKTRITRPVPAAPPPKLASRSRPASSADDTIKTQKGRTKLVLKAPEPNSGPGSEQARDPAAKSASKQLRDHLDHNFGTFLGNGKQGNKKKKSNVAADDETFQPDDDEIDEDYVAMKEKVLVPESEEDEDYKPSKSSERKKKTPKNQIQRRGTGSNSGNKRPASLGLGSGSRKSASYGARSSAYEVEAATGGPPAEVRDGSPKPRVTTSTAASSNSAPLQTTFLPPRLAITTRNTPPMFGVSKQQTLSFAQARVPIAEYAWSADNADFACVATHARFARRADRVYYNGTRPATWDHDIAMLDVMTVEFKVKEEHAKAQPARDAEKAMFAGCADSATYALQAETAMYAVEDPLAVPNEEQDTAMAEAPEA